MLIEKLDFGGLKPREAIARPYGFEIYRLAEYSTSIWDSESRSSFSATEMDAIEESILAVGLCSEDLWLRELRRGEADVFVALLLPRLFAASHSVCSTDGSLLHCCPATI